jgi:hypothetical protein
MMVRVRRWIMMKIETRGIGVDRKVCYGNV